MTKSKNYGFNLPSRDTDDIADINQIARNFEIIDEELYAVSAEAGEAGGTAEEARGYAARAYELVGEKASAITSQVSGDVITLSDSSDLPLRDLKVYGKTTQESTPSPENPQALETPTDVQVKVTGKNLIPFPYITADKTTNGITFTVQNDGGVRVVGTATADAFFDLCKHRFSNSNLYADITSKNTDGQIVVSGAKVMYEAGVDLTYIYIRNGTAVDTVIYPQIEYGTTPTKYEPYTEQILTIPTMSDIGLAGVPVASGGNYTDANGQQWVCDEVDFKRGVYIQRIMKYTLTGTERWGISSVPVTNAARFDCTVSGYPAAVIEDVLSSHCVYSGINKIDTSIGMNMWARAALDDLYRLNLRIVLPTGSTVETLTTFLQEEMTKGTPVEILYALNTPIETPLDEKTLAAFAALHTNKPNTTITNDSGAWMSAEYVADTKLYIDNKFAELASAIISNS